MLTNIDLCFRTGDSSPASDEFDFSSSSVRQAKTSVPAFFFPPISTNKSGRWDHFPIITVINEQ